MDSDVEPSPTVSPSPGPLPQQVPSPALVAKTSRTSISGFAMPFTLPQSSKFKQLPKERTKNNLSEEQLRNLDVVKKEAKSSKARNEAIQIQTNAAKKVDQDITRAIKRQMWLRGVFLSWDHVVAKLLCRPRPVAMEHDLARLGEGLVTDEERREILRSGDEDKLRRHCIEQLFLIECAAAYLDDAFNGRLENGKGKTLNDPFASWLAFQIHASTVYTNMLRVMSLVFCLVMLWLEPPCSYRPHAHPTNPHLWIFEVACLILFLSDLLLRAVYMGPRAMAKKGQLKVLIGVVCVCWLDLIIHTAVPHRYFSFRFSRIFRPLIFLIRDKTCMQLFKIILEIVPRLAPMFVLLMFLVVGFGIAGIQLCTNALFQKYLDDRGVLGRMPYPFSDVPQAMLSLLTLLTLESYDDVLVPYVTVSPWLMVYFLMFLCLGVLVLLNMVIAVQVDKFATRQGEVTLKAIDKERKTLLVVFHLSRGQQAVVTKQRWQALVKAYHPAMPTEVISQLFHNCDTDNNNTIDEFEFLQLCDLLRVDVYSNSVRSSSLHVFALRCLLHRMYFPFVASVIAFNTLAVALLRCGVSEWAVWLVVGFDHACVAVFALDALVCYTHIKHNRLTGVMAVGVAVVSVATVAWVHVHNLLLPSEHVCQADRFRLLWLAATVRWFRVIALPLDLSFMTMTRRQVEVLWRVKDPLVDFFKLLSLLMYMFGVAGMELFPSSSLFASVRSTLNTLLQLANQENWPALMDQTVQDMHTRWVAVYFIAYIFIVGIIVINLMMAVMYFITSRSEKKLTSEENPADENPVLHDSDKDKVVVHRRASHWVRQFADQDKSRQNPRADDRHSMQMVATQVSKNISISNIPRLSSTSPSASPATGPNTFQRENSLP